MTSRALRGEEAEIAVVGAGPCGSTAAAVLAELGHDVLLIDKDEFPRTKPCGDGILSPAVEMAERIGVNDLIDSTPEIEATRLIVDHRRQTITHFPKASQPRPRCIPREDFDAALLAAARGLGARFLKARVEGLAEAEHGAKRLTGVDGDGDVGVAARFVIAADGATSRLRRLTAPSVQPHAYAIRRYFHSPRPLDAVFELYLPIEVDGQVLAGYGWVFPIDAHTINVGVGVAKDPHYKLPPLRRVLAAFVEELRAKAASRFEGLEPITEPIGSPVSMRSPLIASEVPGVVLTGDAAGTVHPITGEGIAFAMRSGEAVARLVHGRLRRNGGPVAPGVVELDGGRFWHAFPQVGTDTSALYRAFVSEMGERTEVSGIAGTELLNTVKRMVRTSGYDTGTTDAPVWIALEARDRRLSQALEHANDALLDRLADPMPFVTEVLHYSIRARLGPMYAAVVLALALGSEGELSETMLEAAVAAEAVGVLPEILTMLVDRARSKVLRVNNALAVLTGDFAATRALGAASRVGSWAVTALAHACQLGCEGGMRDANARFAPNRPVEDWTQAAAETCGAAAVLAAQLGSALGGGAAPAAEELESFGRELGIAIRMSEELASLVGTGTEERKERAAKLRHGIYPLPVLYATEADPSLARLLAQHSAEGGLAEEIVEAVRDCGALARAGAECTARAREAGRLAAELGDGSATLEALAAVPVDHLAGRLQATDLAGISSVGVE